MASIPEMLAIATTHHRAGRMAEADRAYREVLRMDPRHPNAWHFLGLLASQIGKQEEASEYLQRAIQLRPDDAAFHRNLGVIREAMWISKAPSSAIARC